MKKLVGNCRNSYTPVKISFILTTTTYDNTDLANDIHFKKIEGGWAGLVLAKIRLILAADIPSKKIEGGWALSIVVAARLILANDIPSKKTGGSTRPLFS